MQMFLDELVILFPKFSGIGAFDHIFPDCKRGDISVLFGQTKIQHFYLRFHRPLSLVSRYFQPNGMASRRRVRRDSYGTFPHGKHPP